MNVIGVIVTYNRKKLLMENLQMLSIQTRKPDHVVIIDNHSSDGTWESVQNYYDLSREWIHYVYMDENTGGAGGFYYGMKTAYELGADYIWLMDDDGKAFDNHTLEYLMDAVTELKEKNQKLFLNSLVTVDGETLSFGFFLNKTKEQQMQWLEEQRKKGNYLFGKANPFNGTLLSRETIEKVGYVRKEFFISRDETDYFRRCEDSDVLIATVLNSIYQHPASKFDRRRIGKHSVVIYNDINKEYYVNRNVIYSYRDSHKVRGAMWCIMSFLTIVLYEDNKGKRIRMLHKAISDAKYNRMGKVEE